MSEARRKILFIDRDGTLIEEPEDFQVDRLDKVRLAPGVIPNLLALMQREGELVVDLSDEVLDGACVVHDGTIRHEPTRQLVEREAPA